MHCLLTVPETFYFPIFAFVHRSLTVRSPCIQRALIVRSSFTVLRSAFTVRSRSPFTKRSLTVRSPMVHKAFIFHSAFSLHCHSELWSWKIIITILERSDDKEGGVCFIFLNKWFFLTKIYEEFIEFLRAWARSKIMCHWSSKTRPNSYRRHRTTYNTMYYLLTKYGIIIGVMV